MITSLINSAPLLLQAIGQTVILAIATISCALILGFALMECGVHGGRGAALVVKIITQAIRGVPVLVFVFLIYYTLPVINVRIDKFYAAIIALSVFFSVFASEILRRAVTAIPVGQRQSGLASGMSRWEIESIVVIPQAIRIALPALMNLAAIIIKSTSIVSIIGVWELTYATNDFVMRTMQPFLYLFAAMAIYFLICYGLVLLGHRLAQRLNISQRSA
jgi:His/Glu/Gln/Arg/opine family amino acid ABC transporter permease subunit